MRRLTEWRSRVPMQGVALGLALLSVGFSWAAQSPWHRPRADEASGPISPSAGGHHESPIPFLDDGQEHRLPDACLRSERTTTHPAASRGLGPALPFSLSGGLPGSPRLVAARIQPGTCP